MPQSSQKQIQQQVQSSAIVWDFVALVAVSQAVAVQNTTQLLVALQQNQSQDKIRCFNQQSNVGAQQANGAQNFSSGSL